MRNSIVKILVVISASILMLMPTNGEADIYTTESWAGFAFFEVSNPQSSQPNPIFAGLGGWVSFGQPADTSGYQYAVISGVPEDKSNMCGGLGLWNISGTYDLGPYGGFFLLAPMVPGTGLDSVDVTISLPLDILVYWDSGSIWDYFRTPDTTAKVTFQYDSAGQLGTNFGGHIGTHANAIWTGEPTYFWYHGNEFAETILNYDTVRISAVTPEPTTLLLLGSGLIGLAGYGRKRFFKK